MVEQNDAPVLSKVLVACCLMFFHFSYRIVLGKFENHDSKENFTISTLLISDKGDTIAYPYMYNQHLQAQVGDCYK